MFSLFYLLGYLPRTSLGDAWERSLGSGLLSKEVERTIDVVCYNMATVYALELLASSVLTNGISIQSGDGFEMFYPTTILINMVFVCGGILMYLNKLDWFNAVLAELYSGFGLQRYHRTALFSFVCWQSANMMIYYSNHTFWSLPFVRGRTLLYMMHFIDWACFYRAMQKV